MVSKDWLLFSSLATAATSSTRKENTKKRVVGEGAVIVGQQLLRVFSVSLHCASLLCAPCTSFFITYHFLFLLGEFQIGVVLFFFLFLKEFQEPVFGFFFNPLML